MKQEQLQELADEAAKAIAAKIGPCELVPLAPPPPGWKFYGIPFEEGQSGPALAEFVGTVTASGARKFMRPREGTECTAVSVVDGVAVRVARQYVIGRQLTRLRYDVIGGPAL